MFLIHSLNMNTSADLKCKFREWQIKSLHLSGRKKILFPVSKLHEGNVTSIKRKLSLNIYFKKNKIILFFSSLIVTIAGNTNFG